MTPNTKDKHPLILAICQVRFSPIVKIGEYIPDLQDILRKSGFPKYNQHSIASFRLELKPGPATPPVQETEMVWEFTNGDDSRSIIVTNASIAVICLRRDYTDSTNFLESLVKGFGNLHELAKPLAVTRIGLRYIDLIEPQDDLPLDECLERRVHDDEFMRGESNASYSQLVKRLPMRNGSLLVLNVRTANASDAKGPVLTPDFQLYSLRPQFPMEVHGPHAVLDIDNSFTFTRPNEEVDAEAIVEHFRELHTHHKKAFESATTRELRKIYGL